MVTLLNVDSSFLPAEPRRFVPDSGKAPASVKRFTRLVTSAVDLHEAAIA